MSEEVSPEILAVHRDLVENVRVAREKLHLLEEIFPQLADTTEAAAETVTLISQRPARPPTEPPPGRVEEVATTPRDLAPPEPALLHNSNRPRKLPASKGKLGPDSESTWARMVEWFQANPRVWVDTNSMVTVAIENAWRPNKSGQELRRFIGATMNKIYSKNPDKLERRPYTGDNQGRFTPTYDYRWVGSGESTSTMGAASPTDEVANPVVDPTAAYYGWIEFLLECSTVREANPHWRDGKLVWNTLQKHRPILGDAFAKQFPSFYNWMDSGLTKDQFQEGLSWIESRWDATEYKEAK